MKLSSFLIPACAGILCLGISFSCSKSGGSDTGNPGGNNSGQDTILANIGNNIILPSYASLNVSVNSLDSAILDFNAGPGSDKLKAVQALFKTAYLSWQSASEFNYFGPASTAQPTLAGLDLFPPNATTIETNVTTGNTNVNAFANREFQKKFINRLDDYIV